MFGKNNGDALRRVTVRAPGVVKLFGEHAVVYGKPSVGATVNMYSKSVTEHNREGFYLKLSDLGVDSDIPNKVLADLYIRRTRGDNINNFIDTSTDVDKTILPLATIAGNLFHQYGKPINATTTLSSGIPTQRGFASSATISVCFAVGISKFLGVKMTDSEMVKLAREGEKIAHRSEGAGIIDVNVSYYGGCISYSEENGINRINMGKGLEEADLLMVDTGPKRSTSETVRAVAELMQKKERETSRIIDDIGNISLDGIAALKMGDLRALGELMFLNQDMLRRLGVSSDGLDKTVKIAREYGAYGAKLSGGGGGGLAIVLSPKGKSLKIISLLSACGFGVSRCELTNFGAKSMVDSEPQTI